MRLHPSYSADAHSKKSEGARDAARSNRSAGNSGKNQQVRLLSSVPGAVFEALLCKTPGG